MLQTLPPLSAAFAVLLMNADALLRAALLLGGARARQRVATLLSRAVSDDLTIGALQHELRRLHRLLSLEDVGHPDRIETAKFSSIHPDDPVVAEICRLTDMIAAHLDALPHAIASPARKAA